MQLVGGPFSSGGLRSAAPVFTAAGKPPDNRGRRQPQLLDRLKRERQYLIAPLQRTAAFTMYSLFI
jgi:hypothetical protein